MGAIGKQELRALSPRPSSSACARRREAVFGEQLVPGKDSILRDQDVGVAVAGNVDEPDVGVLVLVFGVDLKAVKSLPAALGRTPVEARHRPLELNKVQPALAGEIEQLLAAACQGREPRLFGHPLERAERAIAEIPLVVPGSRPARSARRSIPRCRGRPSDRGSRRRRPAGSRCSRDRRRGPSRPPVLRYI